LWSKAGNRQGGFKKHRSAPSVPDTETPIGKESIDLLHQGPLDLDEFERQLDWGLESFEEAHYSLNENPVPVPHEDEPKHPPPGSLRPRAVSANVVVVRQDEQGDYWVLLHRQAHWAKRTGTLAVLHGKHEDWEEDSRVTAIREVVEEAGLLDAEHFEGAMEAYHDLAERRHAPPPLKFELIHQSPRSDWWLLQIQGEGVFTPQLVTTKSAPIRPMLSRFDEAVYAPTPVPGHAWFRLDRAIEAPPHLFHWGLPERLADVRSYLDRAEEQRSSP